MTEKPASRRSATRTSPSARPPAPGPANEAAAEVGAAAAEQPSTEAAAAPATEPATAEPATEQAPSDTSRRQFFRRVAGEVLSGAGQVVGAVTELRDRSAAEASALFGNGQDGRGGAGAADHRPAVALDVPADAPDAAPAGFRTPFRFESDDVLLLIDQRQLPDRLVELRIRTAAEAAAAIRDMVVRGAPAIGQVAAIGLALTARRAAKAQPHARRAIIDGAANTLRAARPTAVNLGWAVDRLMTRYEEIGKLSPEGGLIADALHAEAMAIVAEATEDHGRLAEAGQEVLPTIDGRPLEVLTHCNTGPLACGQFGTALGIVQVAHAAEVPIHVWVDETRPYLQGARLTAWELREGGVDHTLIPDMAAGPLIAQGRVDVILVGADRIAANGDTANKLGTYTLAVLAARHGIPFVVCAPLSSVDLATPDGAAIPIEDRPAAEVATVRGVRIAPEGTEVKNPSFDVTPAELITAIVTEEGVVRAPFEAGLRDAMDRRDARRREATGPYALEPARPVGAAF